MTAADGPTPIDPVELYLDGMLEGEALRAFETRLQGDESLRRIVDEHRTLDARLRAAYQPPNIRINLSQAASLIPSAPQPAAHFKFPIAPRYIAYAAIIGIAAAVGWWRMQPPPLPRATQLAAGTVYKRLMDKGFQPEFVCTTDEAFNKTMLERFGQGLLIAAAPNTELIGWAYSDGYAGGVISSKELILMAKVDGRETLVFMDQAKRDHRIAEESPQGMHVHKRQVGDLVLYELSPSTTPLLIDRAYEPPPQPESP